MLFLFFFSNCAVNSSRTPSSVTVVQSAESSNWHFKNFDVTVPTGWIGAGNTTKMFYNDLKPDIRLLIGEDDNPEDDISKELELFEGKNFYKDRIKFIYETYESEFVTGVLVNERLERDYYFCGYYLEKPDAYIFCIYETPEDRDFSMELVKDVYLSLSLPEK